MTLSDRLRSPWREVRTLRLVTRDPRTPRAASTASRPDGAG
ncbi:MAG: hypothetical protein OXG35_28190 [Acidobacteria bacterium]|nr:hypothetical protein [Acidobacteriota bacterium]